MVAAQVMGNDVAVNIGGMSGQLRAQRLQAADRPQRPPELPPARRRLRRASASTAPPGSSRTASASRENLERSLMLVTALTPHIGYDAAARIAKTAHAHREDAARGRRRARPRHRGAVRRLGPAGEDGGTMTAKRPAPRSPDAVLRAHALSYPEATRGLPLGRTGRQGARQGVRLPRAPGGRRPRSEREAARLGDPRPRPAVRVPHRVRPRQERLGHRSLLPAGEAARRAAEAVDRRELPRGGPEDARGGG